MSRDPGFDVARALAIVGMVLVNYRLALAPDDETPRALVGSLRALEGRASATFVVLAGIGMSLASRDARARGDAAALSRARRTFLRRALALFVCGFAYVPLWPADILHFYGVYVALGALALASSGRVLWTLAAGAALVFVALAGFVDYEEGWDFEALEYEGIWTPAGLVRHLFFNGFHPVFPWVAFLFAGLWLGRRDLRDARVRRRVAAWGLGVAAAAELGSRALVRSLGTGAGPEEREVVAAVFGTASMPPFPLYLLSAGGVAFAVVALCVGACAGRGDLPAVRALARTGELALTLYVAHVVLGLGAAEAAGWIGASTAPRAFGAAVAFCALAIAFAVLWRSRFARGPLEVLLRAWSRR